MEGRGRGEKRGRARGREREWEEREGEGGRGPQSECVVSSQCITTHLVPRLFPRITRRSLCMRLLAVMIQHNGYKAMSQHHVKSEFIVQLKACDNLQTVVFSRG